MHARAAGGRDEDEDEDDLAEHDDEHDDELDADAEHGEDGEEDHDEEREQSRARLAAARSPSDGATRKPDATQSTRTRRRRRRRRSGRGRLTALRQYINDIYGQKEAGIIVRMIKSESEARSDDLGDLIMTAAGIGTGLLPGKFSLLATIFLEGVKVISSKLKQGDSSLDFIEFCQKYIAALPAARNKAYDEAKDKLEANPKSRVVSAAKDLALRHGVELQQDQGAQIIDAWTNALRRLGKDPRAHGGVGLADDTGSPYDTAAAGRMHIEGLRINHTFDLETSGAKVTMKGVPGKAPDVNLKRRLMDIHVARTFEVEQERIPFSRFAEFGIGPDRGDIPSTTGVDETSKAVLASFVERKTLDPSRFPEDEEVIKDNWHRGARSLWSFLQRKQVGDLTGDIKG